MASALTVVRYTDARAAEWDGFVRLSAAPFLFERGYMDYHRERFADASLMLYDGRKLVALFPATVHGDSLSSHRGLTYGGFLHDRVPIGTMIQVFNAVAEHAERGGLSSCEYKPVPYIYRAYPAQEDLYALFRLEATLEARGISAAIPLATRMSFTESRRGGLRKAARAGARIVENDDFDAFWPMLEATLGERHGAAPVHSLAEIALLRSRFPDRIRLFLASAAGEVGAGCVIYSVGPVAHVQYIGSTTMGRSAGLLDALFDHVIERCAADGKSWFDFGTSTEQGGRVLNGGLAFQKEGFGGRGVVYDTYRYSLARRIG